MSQFHTVYGFILLPSQRMSITGLLCAHVCICDCIILCMLIIIMLFAMYFAALLSSVSVCNRVLLVCADFEFYWTLCMFVSVHLLLAFLLLLCVWTTECTWQSCLYSSLCAPASQAFHFLLYHCGSKRPHGTECR